MNVKFINFVEEVTMLTKDSIKAIHDYAAETISYVFPGLFLLETIYHKGIFSISLTTSYDFIILLFWSMAISILYHHIAFITFALETDIKLEHSDEARITYSQLYAPIVIFLAVLTYIISKVAEYFGVVSSILGLPAIHILFMLSFLATVTVAYPIGWIYKLALKQIIKRFK